MNLKNIFNIVICALTIICSNAAIAQTTGPYCGAVGTEGCTAIACTDTRIKGWAISCEINRGPENISDSTSRLVTYGTEADAVGAATTNTMDVVSLGDGGTAVVTFETPIANGQGFDFAVFENSFNDAFLELAFVEVSSDGEHFVRFPAHSLTPSDTIIGGMGGIDPTMINNLAGKYRVGYGTPFDLEELRDSANIDINNITHVRLVDVVGSNDPRYATYDAFGNIVIDPFPTLSYSGGFDLDGVCVLNQHSDEPLSILNTNADRLRIYPNPAQNIVFINGGNVNHSQELQIINMLGNIIYRTTIEPNTTQTSINTNMIPNGIYSIHLAGKSEKLVIKH